MNMLITCAPERYAGDYLLYIHFAVKKRGISSGVGLKSTSLEKAYQVL